MKQLIHKSFLSRNTPKGIKRYLSSIGMDVANVRYEAGPDKKHVYAVDDVIPEPVALVEEVKPEPKKKFFKKSKKK